jgi:hypothetical protein
VLPRASFVLCLVIRIVLVAGTHCGKQFGIMNKLFVCSVRIAKSCAHILVIRSK